jgi:hypothetical protein
VDTYARDRTIGAADSVAERLKPLMSRQQRVVTNGRSSACVDEIESASKLLEVNGLREVLIEARVQTLVARFNRRAPG